MSPAQHRPRVDARAIPPSSVPIPAVVTSPVFDPVGPPRTLVPVGDVRLQTLYTHELPVVSPTRLTLAPSADPTPSLPVGAQDDSIVAITAALGVILGCLFLVWIYFKVRDWIREARAKSLSAQIERDRDAEAALRRRSVASSLWHGEWEPTPTPPDFAAVPLSPSRKILLHTPPGSQGPWGPDVEAEGWTALPQPPRPRRQNSGKRGKHVTFAPEPIPWSSRVVSCDTQVPPPLVQFSPFSPDAPLSPVAPLVSPVSSVSSVSTISLLTPPSPLSPVAIPPLKAAYLAHPHHGSWSVPPPPYARYSTGTYDGGVPLPSGFVWPARYSYSGGFAAP